MEDSLETDRAQLLVLYNAAGGPAWVRNIGWITNHPDIGDLWAWVRTRDDRVVALKLTGNNLKGTIPEEVGKLSALEELSLNANYLYGPIPSSLGNVHHLKSLFLSKNSLTGNIPDSLGNLSGLTELLLEGNKLEGPIPASLGNLHELQVLGLSNNKLSGTIPSEIGKLTALTTLSASSNQLTGPLPEAVRSFTRVTVLQLDHNQLEGYFEPDRAALVTLYNVTDGPSWGDPSRRRRGLGHKRWTTTDHDIRPWDGVMTRHIRVVELNLSGGNVTGTIPEELGNLSALERLILHGNHLKGPIAPSLGNLHELNTLDLSNNELSGPIPGALGNLSKLTTLLLHDNQLQGSIPMEFASLTLLVRVNLSGNSFDGGSPGDMYGADVSRWMQTAVIRGYDGQIHSWAWRAVQTLTLLWHFWLPVLDDVTDFFLLWQTFGTGTSSGLWWICASAFVVSEYERIYIVFFLVVFVLRFLLHMLCWCCWFPCNVIIALTSDSDDSETDGHSRLLSALAFGQPVDLKDAWPLLVDSVLWVLFGSRARSGDLMHQFGLAGEASTTALMSTGLGNNAIDVLVFYHPYRYLGAFVMSFPRHRGVVEQPYGVAWRRTTVMVRAVGETLVVDPIFVALSIVSSGWDDNLTGLVVFSAAFSIIELVTELQYYVTEAEAAMPYIEAPLAGNMENGIAQDRTSSGGPSP